MIWGRGLAPVWIWSHEKIDASTGNGTTIIQFLDSLSAKLSGIINNIKAYKFIVLFIIQGLLSLKRS
jgi:hypothetical protein